MKKKTNKKKSTTQPNHNKYETIIIALHAATAILLLLTAHLSYLQKDTHIQLYAMTVALIWLSSEIITRK